MLNVFPPLHIFQLGVLQDDPWTKRFIDGDINIAINRGGDHEATMLAVIRRKVGASSAQ
jgi:hypothetical protein